jgi:hypothetical protein
MRYSSEQARKTAYPMTLVCFLSMLCNRNIMQTTNGSHIRNFVFFGSHVLKSKKMKYINFNTFIHPDVQNIISCNHIEIVNVLLFQTRFWRYGVNYRKFQFEWTTLKVPLRHIWLVFTVFVNTFPCDELHNNGHFRLTYCKLGKWKYRCHLL